MSRRRAGALVTAVLAGLVSPLLVGAAPAGATPGPANAPEYWFDSWQVPELWRAGVRGKGITIAVVDTGVNAALPQLRGKVRRGINLGDAGGDGRTDRDVDAFGHGTAMASIMVAEPGPFGITGMAPDATILPIAVPLSGTTDVGNDDRLPQAIRYAADHGANIINMSLGGQRIPARDGVACPPDEQAAIVHALSKGAMVIAAAGNDGPTRNTVEEPGVCLGVVSVGAVDASGSVARFSSRQPYLTLSAPGVNIPSLSRVPGSGYAGDGTSQAAALVSASLALVWSAHREEPARRIVQRLLNTLDNPRRRPSPAYGYGVLDAYRAVRGDVPSTAPNPVFDGAAPFLARARAFATPTRAPTPAATATGGFGTYRVGSRQQSATPGVVGGIGTSTAGLALLLLLAVVGLRSRRRGRHTGAPLPAVAPVVATSWPTWAPAVPPEPAPAVPPEPESAVRPDNRPRPRPGPRQEPHPAPPVSGGVTGDPAHAPLPQATAARAEPVANPPTDEGPAMC